MELALYCPETGYYETKRDIIGQRGDFITSVSTGPLFGQLLSFQFAEWLENIPTADDRLTLMEAGAHGGQLAADILSWLRANRAKLFERIEYVIVEPSRQRQAWQREGLAEFEKKVRWMSQLSEFKNRRFLSGIIFSNELLDAFPIRRFGWDAAKKDWFEWGVAVEGETFCWTRIRNLESRIQLLPASILNLPASLLDVLPDNYVVESSPAAEAWWREAAGLLEHGKLMTVDYGYTAGEMMSPARVKGTLRAYYRHRVTDDVLANPGEQDLTAHVNFSAIQHAGEAAGLRTEPFCTQPQFLTRILQKAVAQKIFAQMDAKQARQFQTLTHPEHLGRAFRVLVQQRRGQGVGINGR